MNDWYHTYTSYNIDWIIHVFQEKKKIIFHGVVPIHNDNNFVILDVSLPCDKRPDGQVTIYYYLDSGDKAKNLSAKM